MHELIQEACHALSAHDADTLERLVLKAERSDRNLLGNLAEVERARAVLAAQVNAAATHLAIRSRVFTVVCGDSADSYKATPWQR